MQITIYHGRKKSVVRMLSFLFAILRAYDRHCRFKGSIIFILNTLYCNTRTYVYTVCRTTLVPRRLYPCTHRFVYKPTVLTIDQFPPRFPQQSDHTSRFSRVEMLSDSREFTPLHCCFQFVSSSHVPYVPAMKC